MTLILCEAGDPAASWAAERLRARGRSVDIVTGAALGDAARWEHRIDGTAAAVRVTLADGQILSSDAPRPILNRLGFAPLDRLRATAGEDYCYASQELFAFYLSWLHAWPAVVINRPTPQGLGGNQRHGSAWAALAAAAGLPTRRWRQSDEDPPGFGWAPAPAAAMAFVVAGRALLPPELAGDLAAPCRALAAGAGTALLGIGFAGDAQGGWEMVGASPVPDLAPGGEPLVEALAEALAE
ncbi:MAG: hypothetical protein QOG13_260 [Sphingomonadales bacterium]|jgi:hypothetical protein|nr:hypothetical protein [Sphingomonadales bacterium]